MGSSRLTVRNQRNIDQGRFIVCAVLQQKTEKLRKKEKKEKGGNRQELEKGNGKERNVDIVSRLNNQYN